MLVQRRSIAFYVIISILTCGIASIFWFYQIASDVSELEGKGRSAGVDLLLGILTCGIYYIYCYYKYYEIITNYQFNHGMKVSNGSALLCIVLTFFGLSIVSLAIIESDLNAIYDRQHNM